MEIIFNKVCVLVTAAFALTLVPGFRRSERSLLSVRDRGTALIVFLVLGFVEEASGWQNGWLNERIVAASAAGLVAGPWVGLAVSAFVTWLAVRYDGLPLGSIGIAMLCGGLIGGLLHRWRPKLAQRPLTLSDRDGVVSARRADFHPRFQCPDGAGIVGQDWNRPGAARARDRPDTGYRGSGT